MLENIDLSRNKFVAAPLKSLQKQYFFLISADLSRNKIRDIPADDTVMVNIKELDLSYNPLSAESARNILSEPKTVRKLNLAGTGVGAVDRMETPFMQQLNLSHNAIADVSEKVFERITLLEGLDLSFNAIANLDRLSAAWRELKSLSSLDLSANPIESVVQKDLDGLRALRRLRVSHLHSCAKIEKSAFKNLPNLVELDLHGYPKLGYLDVPGILHGLPALEALNVEIKDAAVGSEQLAPAMNSRLAYVGIWGSRVASLSSGALAGLKMPELTVKICNTSLATVPPSLLLPIPRSSTILLDLSHNQLTTLAPQFLTSLDDRRGHLLVRGVETNPIACDCGVRALRRSGLAFGVRCSAPAYLAGRFLVEIADDDLTCDPHRHAPTAAAAAAATTSPSPSPSSVTTSPVTLIRKPPPKFTTAEPDIIWSLPPAAAATTSSKPPATAKNGQAGGMTIVNNDDTLIIAIVGGVVVFIALLVVVICVIRLRMSSRFDAYHGAAAMAAMPSMVAAAHCNNPAWAPHSLYAYNPNYASTLPSKMASTPSVSPPLRPNYSTIGRPYQNPYCIPYSSDEKDYSLS